MPVATEGRINEGCSCRSGHVRSVWTAAEQVDGRIGTLLEPTTAAAVRLPRDDLPLDSAVTILRASK